MQASATEWGNGAIDMVFARTSCMLSSRDSNLPETHS